MSSIYEGYESQIHIIVNAERHTSSNFIQISNFKKRLEYHIPPDDKNSIVIYWIQLQTSLTTAHLPTSLTCSPGVWHKELCKNPANIHICHYAALKHKLQWEIQFSYLSVLADKITFIWRCSLIWALIHFVKLFLL